MSAYDDPDGMLSGDSMEVNEEEEEEEEGGGPARSALEESIKRKGMNSYYYAHGRKNNAPAWDGQATPRLMSSVAMAPDPQDHPEPIRTYAWSDGEKHVKVYVTVDAVENLREDAVSLEWDAMSLVLTVKAPENKAQVFLIQRLYDEIDNASFRIKREKVILTLTKKEGKVFTWFDLKKEF
uniref:Calcyclin binding protein n=1 Tax=Nannochloropsis gaditana (strain CCMP526) TaxID=1093141 RepID=I2CRF0_NANGC